MRSLQHQSSFEWCIQTFIYTYLNNSIAPILEPKSLNRNWTVSINKSIEKNAKTNVLKKIKCTKNRNLCRTFNCKVQSARAQRQHASILIETSKISIIFDQI